MTDARHLLVIASQCSDMPELPGLAAVARELHDVLRRAELGGCRPALPDGRSLLLLDERDQTNADVYQAVREAIDHTASQRATLVLALIGHGFIPGEDPTLYFMAPGSEDQVRDKAVKVSELLLEASDRPGIAGVVAVVDTCNAAGAAVGQAQLAAGVRSGRTALSVIMASAVGQNAFDLSLSRELTHLLRAGTEAAGAAMFAGDLDTPLRSRLTRQTLAVSTYVGQNGGQESVWLAANMRHASRRARGVVSPSNAARLASALRAVDSSAVPPELWDETALREIQQSVRTPAPAADWDLVLGPAKTKLERLADNLGVALHTTEFLRSWLSESLTTARLRTAVARIRPGSGGGLLGMSSTAFSRVETVVEHLAVNHPDPQDDCRRTMCRFVVALAQESERPLDSPQLLAWADEINAMILFNNAVKQAKEATEDRKLRLIVSLHASPAGDWPPTLDAWLLNGTRTLGHEVFANRAVPDRAGSEQALTAAVDWAEALAGDLVPGLHLHRIEVAVPSTLLLDWCPEDASPERRLGVDYDIVLRWSLRLNPPSERAWIDRRARTRWKRIEAPDGPAPVDWLSRHETDDPQELHALLRDDRYAQAVGLDHYPDTVPISGSDLLDLLLTFSPIVLWPRAKDGFPSHYQSTFNDYWHTLPTGFTDAYRKQWSRNPNADPADIVARLRAVWDDVEWLDFCAMNRRMASARQGGPS